MSKFSYEGLLNLEEILGRAIKGEDTKLWDEVSEEEYLAQYGEGLDLQSTIANNSREGLVHVSFTRKINGEMSRHFLVCQR